MVLPEYKNLTKDELVLADHYAETGNMSGLQQMQRLSAERGGQGIDHERYCNPIRTVPVTGGHNRR